MRRALPARRPPRPKLHDAVWTVLLQASGDDDDDLWVDPGTHSVGTGGLAFDAADSPRSGRRVIWHGDADEPSVNYNRQTA